MNSLSERKARVSEKRVLTPNILHFQIQLVDPPTLAFRAGQFIQVIIAPRILRQYSICSPPSRADTLELCVDISPAGVGSKYMEEITVGDTIIFRGPFGVFVVPETEIRPVHLVATGAGIAPLRSMIYDLLERRSNVPLHLLFGNSSEDVLFYDAELRDLTARYAQFTYVPTLSQPSDRWQGERGRVTEVLRRQLSLSGRPYYVCGSPAMVDETRKALQVQGVPETDIHFEKFY